MVSPATKLRENSTHAKRPSISGRRFRRLLVVAALVFGPPAKTAGAATFQFTLDSRGNVETFDKGWTRVSFPVAPDFGQTLPGHLFEFKEGVYHEIQLGDVEPGRGYYYASANLNETLTVEGNPVETDAGVYETAMDAGWTLLGNPFDFHVEWSNLLVDGEPILDSSAVDDIDVPLNMRADRAATRSYWRNQPLKIINYYTYMIEQPYRMGAWEAHWVRFNRPVVVTWKAFGGDSSLEGLEAKFQIYKQGYAERHRYLGGGSVEAILDPTHTYVIGYEGLGDSIGYTGVTLAGFLWHGDWDLARSNLRYIADCEDPSDPGHLFRHPGLLANPDDNVTSVDQYTMVTLGLTVAMTLDGVPDDIRNEAKRLAWNIINRGIEKNWDVSPGPAGANSIALMIYIYTKWTELLGKPLTLERAPGEAWEYVRLGNLYSYGTSYFQYWGNHLKICRFISLAMLDPHNPELPDAFSDFYIAIKGDQNTFGDILYHWLRGDPLDSTREELAKFPDYIPNSWVKNAYSNANYRWDRDQAWIDYFDRRWPVYRDRETNGVDYMVAYSFLRYALDHPFPDKVPN